MSAARRLVPDFRLPPWKPLGHTPIRALHPRTQLPIYIGHYNLYLNEATGDHGRDVMIIGFAHPHLIGWEKKILVSPTKISTLHYVAMYQDGRWYINRIKANSDNFRIDFNQHNQPINIHVVFTLEIGNEITFTFPYLII
jgi:hypothetical protein